MSSKVIKLVAACLLLLSLAGLAGCIVGYPHGGHGPRHGLRPVPWGYHQHGGYEGGHHGSWR
jgi:hypothetical protein